MQLARADWELRQEVSRSDLPVIPDLFAVFDCPLGPVALAIEVDLGTEPLKVLRAKLVTYARVLACGHGLFGWSEVVLAVALKNVGRTDAVREMLRDSWPGQCVVWSLDAGPRSALASILSSALPPLTDSPRCKGRGVVASPSNSMLGPEEGRRP